MRMARLVASLVVFGGFASAAAAQATITQTTSTCSGDCDNWNSSFRPFDAGLGTLTGITLDVQGRKDVDFEIVDDYDPVTSPVRGTVQLTYAAPMSVVVNGVTYSFDISGAEALTASGHVESFSALGSGTFSIDPSMFASFIGTADNCDGPVSYVPSGICVTDDHNWLLGIPVISESNVVRLNRFGSFNYATYSLIYSYIPGVPEPASWAMMLIGFAAIGLCARGKRGHYGVSKFWSARA
jgi:hypothetical protein